MGSDYEHVNRRVGQQARRRKEADAILEAEIATRDTKVYMAAKAYTDEQVAEVRRDMKLRLAELSRSHEDSHE